MGTYGQIRKDVKETESLKGSLEEEEADEHYGVGSPMVMLNPLILPPRNSLNRASFRKADL